MRIYTAIMWVIVENKIHKKYFDTYAFKTQKTNDVLFGRNV